MIDNKITAFEASAWDTVFPANQQQAALTALEGGKVIYFPGLNFTVSTTERAAILLPTLANPKIKNISFNQENNQISGLGGVSSETRACIQTLMARFAQAVQYLMRNLFPYYGPALQLARTSFRPVEIAQRHTSSYRKDDKRLHVDAFPATPNQGKRIIRVFANIDPQQRPRVWRLGEPFPDVATRFLPQLPAPLWGMSTVLKTLRLTKTRRTHYDHLMLQLHNQMKADEHYQKTAPQNQFEFPANSAWIVQTDQVSHAAMAGQHVLEQTFYLPVAAMQNPATSPLRILENLTGKKLVSHA